jgi:hypothetical protein
MNAVCWHSHRSIDDTCIYCVKYVALVHKGHSPDHIYQVAWLKDQLCTAGKFPRRDEHFTDGLWSSWCRGVKKITWHILTHYLTFFSRLSRLDSLSIIKHINTYKHPAIARNIVNKCGQGRAPTERWRTSMVMLPWRTAHWLSICLVEARENGDVKKMSKRCQFYPISVCICRSCVAQC